MITFKEALAWAKRRNVVLPEEYEKLLPGRLRDKAFTIMSIAQRDQLQFVLDSLAEVLLTGGTFDQWKDRVTSGALRLSLPNHRLDNIFRTNMQTHYNRGHWVQQQAHKTQRPYILYDAVNDTRVRPSHAKLDGVIKHVDDAFWLTYYPPNGFRCRCSGISLTEKQAEARGGITPEPAGGWPKIDAGFDNNPGIDDEVGVRIAGQPVPGGSAHLQTAMLSKNLIRKMKGGNE